MAPLRKRRRAQLHDDVEEKVLDVDSASSSLQRATRKKAKRARISDVGAHAKSSAVPHEPRVDEEQSQEDGYLDYETQRDAGFTDLEDEDGDDQRATQILQRRNERRVENAPASNGIIDSITCINFMCHTKLHVAFGPLINFIIGHNGSGKSAILTAITLCLGGRASFTNRGGSLKSFIKEGEESAILAVKLKNAGQGGFQQDLYGDSIVVERHFNRSGTSSFKVKSENGRTMSTKRADVEEITDYFVLQIDNPMNVLTQDMSRQFLSNSTPREKYRFFLKGVQLEQLDQDYRLLRDTIHQIDSKLASRDHDVKVLEKRSQEAARKLAISEKHDDLREKIGNLSRQMAWAQVDEQEEILNEIEGTVHTSDAQIEEAERLEETRAREFAEATAQVDDVKKDIHELKQRAEPIQEEKTSVKDEFDKNKSELLDLQTEQRTIRDHIRAASKRIEKAKDEILTENARLEAANGGDHARRQVVIEEADQKVTDARARLDEHRPEKPDLELHLENHKKDARAAEPPIEAKRKEVAQSEETLKSLLRDRGQQHGAFHANLPKLLRAIQNERGFREKPVGPVGHHIRLLKPIWSSVLEKSFGATLNSFIVSSKADQELLSKVMRKESCPCPILIDGNRPINNLQEPNAQFDTTLRVLEIDNELVKRQLIVHQAIEQTILIENRNQAVSVMFDGEKPRNVKQCFCLHNERRGWGIRLGYTRGVEPSSSPMPPMTGRPRMKTDVDAQINFQRETIQHLKREFNDLERQLRESHDKVAASQQAVVRHERQEAELVLRVQRAEDQVEKLKDELERDTTVDGRLDALRSGLQETEEEKQIHEGSFEQAINSRDKLNTKASTLRDKLKELNEVIAEMDRDVKRAEKKAARMEDSRHTALQKKNQAIEAVADIKREKERIERKRDAQVLRVNEFTAEATKICARVQVDAGETPDKLDKKLEKLTDDLEKAERQIGGSREAIGQEATETKIAFETAKDQVQDLKDMSHLLTSSYHDRQERWRNFRRFISSRARMNFTYLLSERSFRGSLKTDHKHKVLDLKVEPDETRVGGGRQTKTLSGGEKSFSTICLLLALWEAMGSPVRCLDEFDVFMDSVNRTVSMNMMIDAARNAIGRQFVLITPQSMNNAAVGADVKIIKLSDPERGQTTLPFGE
ncbi:MAG: Structural maintenance of chromosomes protein 6 [Piccolia ochrophora]|nr:MAG: Structural maintenance of chromosomes protein 6 [Piccolia ochrophora]